MIISNKYKYLFVESHFTGSTSISSELIEKYDGREILHKHSRYFEFLNVAEEKAKEYFVFSTIRNPMDLVVSLFYKYKTNHHQRFSDPSAWRKYGGNLSNRDIRAFRKIQKNVLSFSDYFKKYYKIPYDNWNRLSHKKFDYLMRFENLQDDFNEVLKLLGIEPKGLLPTKNKTKKDKGYLELYTPEIRKKAINVFGPYMQKWGYNFPDDWKDAKVSVLHKIEFEFFGALKYLYWRTAPRSSKEQRENAVELFRNNNL